VRIDHVQLAMPAGLESEARAFFAGVLGMAEEEKPEKLRARGGCWFRSGSCSVHVGVDPEFRPQRKAHPAFSVTNLQELAITLDASGYAVVWDDAIPGVSRFYTADPFGNRLEFLAQA